MCDEPVMALSSSGRDILTTDDVLRTQCLYTTNKPFHRHTAIGAFCSHLNSQFPLEIAWADIFATNTAF